METFKEGNANVKDDLFAQEKVCLYTMVSENEG